MRRYFGARRTAIGTAAEQRFCRSGIVVCLAAAGAFSLVGCDHASAAPDSAAVQKQEDAGPQAGEVVTLDLGNISLRQTRPLENSTLNLRFRAHAVVSSTNADRFQKLLRSQEHQVREQLIVAVRTAESWEFDEPDLSRLRRRIQFRLNRWLDASLIDDIVLSDYRFRMD